MNNPKLIQKLEGLAVLIVVLIAYQQAQFSWWYFFLIILLFDISMIGYAFSKKAGAIVYNIGHSFVGPLLLLGLWLLQNNSALLMISLIWIAHIGMDRAFGYGLKLPKGFKHTHLGEIGKKL
jgi:hypothetical protein